MLSPSAAAHALIRDLVEEAGARPWRPRGAPSRAPHLKPSALSSQANGDVLRACAPGNLAALFSCAAARAAARAREAAAACDESELDLNTGDAGASMPAQREAARKGELTEGPGLDALWALRARAALAMRDGVIVCHSSSAAAHVRGEDVACADLARGGAACPVIVDVGRLEQAVDPATGESQSSCWTIEGELSVAGALQLAARADVRTAAVLSSAASRGDAAYVAEAQQLVNDIALRSASTTDISLTPLFGFGQPSGRQIYPPPTQSASYDWRNPRVALMPSVSEDENDHFWWCAGGGVIAYLSTAGATRGFNLRRLGHALDDHDNDDDAFGSAADERAARAVSFRANQAKERNDTKLLRTTIKRFAAGRAAERARDEARARLLARARHVRVLRPVRCACSSLLAGDPRAPLDHTTKETKRIGCVTDDVVGSWYALAALAPCEGMPLPTASWVWLENLTRDSIRTRTPDPSSCEVRRRSRRRAASRAHALRATAWRPPQGPPAAQLGARGLERAARARRRGRARAGGS